MGTVFLTGASGDIGRTIKYKFFSMGYDVIAPPRDELDLSRSVFINDIFDLGKGVKDVDTVIYCAGINAIKSIFELSPEDIKKHAQINYISFCQIVKHLAPQMIKRNKGKILTISSLYSNISKKGRLAYTTSKHALNGAVKTIALELAEHNILVNSLSPGFIGTKMTNKNNSKDKIKKLCDNIPLGRLGTPEEVAELAYFLCSDANTFITGQNINIDGGYLIGRD